jgi:hypothetical protein
MTDLSLAELFGVSPCVAVESSYYDGRRLNSGFGTYASEGNAPWIRDIDYLLPFADHFYAYLFPNRWLEHDLGQIERRLLSSDPGRFAGYLVGGSAIGALDGETGHIDALRRLDEFCNALIYKTRGRLSITLLSDHGHDYRARRRIKLRDFLNERGYRVGRTLIEPGDVVAPEFGLISCAVFHTKSPKDVAQDLVEAEGVDLAIYRESRAGGERDDRVVVLSNGGRAAIDRLAEEGVQFRYSTEQGDPLELIPTIKNLSALGLVSPEGFVADKQLFEATARHKYPDAVYRLWRAFHGLTRHTPDVLVSTQEGYYCGNGLMTSFLDLAASHGALDSQSSVGFAMTTAGGLPPDIRMEDLADCLGGLGVPLTPFSGNREIDERKETSAVHNGEL